MAQHSSAHVGKTSEKCRDLRGDGLAAGAYPRRMKILILEEERVMLEFLEGAFAGRPHDVRSSVSASGALEVLKDWQPDLVLWDVDLAKGKGEDLEWEIARVRVSLHQGVRMILISADPERLARAFHLAEGLLLKPVAAEDLVTMVALAS